MKKLFIILSFVMSVNYGFCQSFQKYDRPGKTLTPLITPKNTFLLEAGFSRDKEKIGQGLKDLYWEHPNLLIKYGAWKSLEFRLNTGYVSKRSEATNSITKKSGIKEFRPGLKFNITNYNDIKPTISLIANYKLSRFPITNSGDTIDGANILLAIKHDITKNFIIAYNIGIDWQYFTFNPAYIYSFSPKFLLDDKWLLFAEVYGSMWEHRGPLFSGQAGLSYYITDKLAVDISGSIGLNKATRNRIIGVGASYNLAFSKN